MLATQITTFILVLLVALGCSSALSISNSINQTNSIDNHRVNHNENGTSSSSSPPSNRFAFANGTAVNSSQPQLTVKQKYEFDRTESRFFGILSMLHYLSPSALTGQLHNALKGKASWLTCELCSTAVGLIRLYPSVYTTQTIFVEMCSTLGYEERQVCAGISDLYGEEFVYILAHSNLTHSEICGLVISPSCSSLEDYPNGRKWTMPLLPLSSAQQQALMGRAIANSVVPTSRSLKSSNNVSSILHLSDIHLDLYYQVNAYSECNEPLCCRAGSSGNAGSQPAGYWGSFGNCDSVLRTVQSLVDAVTKEHVDQYRYVLFTGDYLAHDVWNTTKAEIVTTTRRLNGIFKAAIPAGKGGHPRHWQPRGIPGQPLGVERFSAKWLYEELLSQWSDWIPADSHTLFANNGYYSKSVVEETSGRGVRFIVLNMNYCARLNFWIAYDFLDMGGMLAWMQREMQAALAANQTVYIAGHIVPDTEECATHWVMLYNDIVERYAAIIRGQFFGHTHMDEIRLYFSAVNSSRPVGVAYVTPSVTTFCDVNPAFRLYNTDPATGAIVDHRTYYMNLTETNRLHGLSSPFFTPAPRWAFEYSAREAYNLSSLEPADWHHLMSTINEKKEHLHRYYRFYGRYDPGAGGRQE
ncbi:Sphingomyelin phosphodiesterase [Tyrophagus putrescentiae]|nr:Sphingomyelin phosphodiesterase [Tyrophagus putrescentiae]